MKFIDLFSGIGGFRSGLEMNGHECVAFCEIDKYARQSYKAIYNTDKENEYHDITTITNEEWAKYRESVGIITGGFPCQAFSIAGKRGGFSDTRGTLFFEIARATKQIKPRFLLLENVKGLLSHDKGKTFATILSTLDELGYDVEWQVLNSKDYGVPQNRERVFIIGHLRGECGREILSFRGENKTTESEIRVIGNTSLNGHHSHNVHDINGISPTIQARDYKGPKQIFVKEATKKGYAIANPGDSVNISFPDSETRRGRVGKQIANTLVTNEEQGVVTDNMRIRKLTPLECWRLQGFTDEEFYKAKNSGVSDSQLYKQAGNSVTVNVIDSIAKKLF